VPWRTVVVGLLLQALLGFVFLYWEAGNAALRAFGHAVNDFLSLSAAGTAFVWGPLADTPARERVFGPGKAFGFAVQVLPTLIFFSALMGVLYHLGVMQFVVRCMAAVMVRFMRTSGSESLSVCADIFVGQTEAPLLVKPFLPRMTRSELHAVMVGGYATIAGGVFVLYTSFGIDPGHLMVASVMAAPASLVCSKLAFPETEASETMGRVVRSVGRTTGNVVEAAANGATDGLLLALNVGAMLVAFLGLVAVADWLLAGLSGAFWGAPAATPLTLGRIFGWLFSPLAAVMGASLEGPEILALAELLGTKLAVTELIAYQQLGTMKDTLSPRTVMIASFALCGFANFASVAIQLGGLGAMAPDRKKDIAALGLRAMLVGALATCMTACLAGVLARDGSG
jgi:CNT family concentrative nucleoside transporter